MDGPGFQSPMTATVTDMYCMGLHCCDDETHLATERTVEANAWDGGKELPTTQCDSGNGSS